MAPRIAIIGGGPSGLALAGILERKGIDFIVYEKSAEEIPPYGGCLDIHAESGQRAIEAAGVVNEFRANSRGGQATTHLVFDYRGEQVSKFGEGRDSPEIDRWRLRKVLLTNLPKDKVVWSKALAKAERDREGKIVLTFADGTIAPHYDLVVGADGSQSKLRHLITPTKPMFAGQFYIAGKISSSNPYFSKMSSMAGPGSMIILGPHCNLFNQMQGDGSYRIDVGIKGPEDLLTNGSIDFSDTEAAKKYFLQKDMFGSYTAEFQDIVRSCEGPFRPWPLYFYPPEALSWKTQPGVTLIGDAAHVTTPFVGDGVNCALLDSVHLAEKLEKYGVTTQAISEYEREMFPYAKDVITRSVQSGHMYFHGEGSGPFARMMREQPLIGKDFTA